VLSPAPNGSKPPHNGGVQRKRPKQKQSLGTRGGGPRGREGEEEEGRRKEVWKRRGNGVKRKHDGWCEDEDLGTMWDWDPKSGPCGTEQG